MKIPITTILLCFMVFFAQANETDTIPLAPDFTVTTAQNEQFRLYEDYLNQGKTVVLDLFFTTCPICSQMAPLMEPFYQEWGGGNGPVEFLSISIQQNDSNDDVRRSLANRGHSFPGVGDDGGARAARLPYTNGTYGPFIGTPTFVVIAPNGTVQYDLRGNSFEATIDSIDQAIRRTGVQKPQIEINLTGSIRTPDGDPVARVEIEPRTVAFGDLVSRADGDFDTRALLVARDLYGIRFRKSGDYINGVSTFDVVRIQRHLLGVQPFATPYELLAADVDRSGNISILDIIYLRRLILSYDTTLPNDRSWLIVNEAYEFLDPQNPFFEAYQGDATTFAYRATRNVPPFKAIAIKIGDLDFNAR